MDKIKWDDTVVPTEQMMFEFLCMVQQDDEPKCKHDLRISFIELRAFLYCTKNCGYKKYLTKENA